jgi:hypothetical protein
MTIFFVLLTASLITAFNIRSMHAADIAYAEYRNLGYHGLDNLFSSLMVSGTVILYDDYDLNFSANTITFTNTSVANLTNFQRGVSDSWDNAVKSLQVNGTVTLYEHSNFSGRTATFTNNDLPYEDIGTEWNANSQLNKSENAWDSRTWQWSLDRLDTFEGDTNNSVSWNSDGLVESCAQDGSLDPWKAVDFEQGYERNESQISNLTDWDNWDNKAASVRVEGSVTVFDGVGYTGENSTLTSSIPDLAVYNWSSKISSLKLTQDSRTTLYDETGFNGTSKSFVYPTYQPPDLTLGNTGTLTLEGVVQDWYTDSFTWTSWGWTGARFDVVAVENRSSNAGKILMLEMYFLRGGANLAWQWWDLAHGFPGASWQGSDKECHYNSGKIYNYLVALDGFPELIERTIYPGDVTKWKIDVKTLIQRACNFWPSDLDIDKLSIAKLSFTLEAARNTEDFDPKINCSLNRLRLGYTSAPPTRVYVEPFKVQSEALIPNTTFNVSVKIDNIPVSPGAVGIDFKLSWNSSLLNAVNMDEVLFHEVTPPTEIDNLWRLRHIVANDSVQYAYTYQDLKTALAKNYAPINGSHTVARITLKVKAIGTCALHFDMVKIGDPQGKPVLSQLVNGSFDNLPGPRRAIVFVDPPRTYNSTLTPGGNFTITINITNASSLVVMEFKLDFDASMLQVNSATKGNLVSSSITPIILVNNTGGFIIFSFTSPSPLEGNGTALIIELNVQANRTRSTFQLNHVRLVDNNNQELPFSTANGSFSNAGLLADINHDGTVDIYDAILLAGAYGAGPSSQNWNPEADLNADNLIDIYDAILLAGNYGKTE